MMLALPRPTLLVLCAGASLAAVAAGAQTRMPLQGGFSPDPWSLEVVASGDAAAADRVGGCPGWAPAAPPLTVALTAPSQPLRLHGHGEGVVGLLVVGPDGVLRCAPAGPDGIATLRVDPMAAGDHAISPLAAESGAAVTARILVSEYDLDPDRLQRALGLGATSLTLDAPPAFGRHALATDGTTSVQVTLSAVSGADLAAPDCSGRIDPARPDAVVEVGAAEPSLVVRGRADVDTTLVVIGPDGVARCNDDTHGYDPEVTVNDAAAGAWAVWVGVYSGSGGETATLEFGRSAGEAGAPATALDTTAPPAAGLHPLGAESLSVPLTISGGVDASEVDWSCVGQIDPSRPDVVVRLDADEATLAFGVSSGADSTLIVVDPAGTVHCNDDTHGLDPALTLAPAEPGDYAVWVGAYSGAGSAATLSIGRDPAAISGATGAIEASLGFGRLMENPFEGRPVASAAEALGVLMEDPAIAGSLSYDRLEETGPEGFILHGVTIAGPDDGTPPLAVGRLVVSNLDLAGLAGPDGPSRFAIALEAVDYQALAAASDASLMPLLPPLAGNPALSLAVRLLPAEAASDGRALDATVDLEGQFALRFGTQLGWGDGPAGAIEAAKASAMHVEFENRGFLGTMLRAQAAEMGMQPQQLVAMALEGLAEGLAPLAPGTPQADLVAVLGEALADPDRPGIIRLELATDEPDGLQPVLEAVRLDPGQVGRLQVDLRFEPIE